MKHLHYRAALIAAAVMTASLLSSCGNTDSEPEGLSKLTTAETSSVTTSATTVTSVTAGSTATAATTTPTTAATAKKTTKKKKTTTTATETEAVTEPVTEATTTTAAPVVTAPPVSSTPAPVERPAGLEDYMPAYGEWCGNIVVVDRYEGDRIRGLPPFYGYLSTGQQYAAVLNQYKAMVGSGVNVYNMSCPLSSAYYIPKGMENTFTEQHMCIRNVGDYLNGVTNIDIYDTLAAHLGEYIYSRTDHHWQPLGAYYAAQQFAAAAGVPFADLSQYDKVFKTGYLGSLYNYSGNIQELADHLDTFTYYKPKNSYTTRYYDGYFQNGYDGSLFFDSVSGAGCYCSFLGSDDKICEIDSDVDNGRVLVIIKDSYGNALVPFLVQSFDKIYVVDFRYTYIKMNDLFTRVGATDVLFGATISSAYADSRISTIQSLMM